MTGRLRKLYGIIGMIAFLLVLLAVLIASNRASPLAGNGAERSGVKAFDSKQQSGEQIQVQVMFK